MTPTQERLAAERRARLARMQQASLNHFDRCYDEAQALLPKVEPLRPPKPRPAQVNIESLPQPMRLPLQVVTIQGAVCERFQVSRGKMLGDGRTRDIVRPRQIAMFLTRELMPRLSLPQIGKKFGGKDHTTVLHGIRTIGAALSLGDTKITGAVTELRAELAHLAEAA